MRVHIYRNLRLKCWSIRDAKTRRVIGYADVIRLTDVTFHVGESGRQRVLRTGHKNVHAWVAGTITEKEVDAPHRVVYNPYAGPFFLVKDTGEPLRAAGHALLVSGGVWVS